MGIKITGAARLTGIQVPDNSQEPTPLSSDEEGYPLDKNDMAPTLDNTADNTMKKQEEKRRREREEQITRMQRQDSENLSRDRENDYRLKMGQATISQVEKAAILTQNADVSQGLENTKQMLELVINGGFDISSAISGATESLGEDGNAEENPKPSNPTSTTQRPVQQQTFQPNIPQHRG